MREYQPPISDEVLQQVKLVSDDWLHLPGRRERRFSLGVFDEVYLSGYWASGRSVVRG